MLEIQKLNSNIGPKKSSKSSKSSKKQSVLNTSKSANIQPIITNDIDERINLFYEYLTGTLKEHDSKYADYKVTDNMIKGYAEANDLSGYWIELLKNNRILLYLDQYLNFYNIYYDKLEIYMNNKEDWPKNNNKVIVKQNLSLFFESPELHNYRLPILKELIDKYASNKNNKLELEKTVLEYKKLLLDNCKLIIEKNKYDCDIKKIKFLSSHGKFDDDTLLIVPKNVIIAFMTPINKYSYSKSIKPKEHYEQYLELLTKYRKNNDFLKNPACYLRNNNCYKNTIYYYPGQIISNYLFSLGDEDEIRNFHSGFYKFNKEKKAYVLNNKFFNNKEGILYVDLKTLFSEKIKYIDNSILYISCCRKCDLDVDNSTVEFLYRYEFINSCVNMSKCLALSYDSKDYNSSCEYGKDALNNPINNNYNPNLFYNSALSFNFKYNTEFNLKKYKYLNQKLTYNELMTIKGGRNNSIYYVMLTELKNHYNANKDNLDKIDIIIYNVALIITCLYGIKKYINKINVDTEIMTYIETMNYEDIIKLFDYILNNNREYNNFLNEQITESEILKFKSEIRNIFSKFIDKIDKSKFTKENYLHLIKINAEIISILIYKLPEQLFSFEEMYVLLKEYYTIMLENSKNKESILGDRSDYEYIHEKIINIMINPNYTKEINQSNSINLLCKLIDDYIREKATANKNNIINNIKNNIKNKTKTKKNNNVFVFKKYYYDMPKIINYLIQEIQKCAINYENIMTNYELSEIYYNKISKMPTVLLVLLEAIYIRISKEIVNKEDLMRFITKLSSDIPITDTKITITYTIINVFNIPKNNTIEFKTPRELLNNFRKGLINEILKTYGLEEI